MTITIVFVLFLPILSCYLFLYMFKMYLLEYGHVLVY